MPKNADTPMFVKVAGKVIVFNAAILAKELAPTETQTLSSAKSMLVSSALHKNATSATYTTLAGTV